MQYAKRAVLIAAGIAAGLGQAFAADLPTKAPIMAPPPVVMDWTGFYIGGHVGGGRNSGDLRADYLPTPAFFGLFPTAASSNASGLLGGLQAGYNWQFAQRWVVGVEGDYSWTRMNSTFSTFGAYFVGTPNTTQPTTWTRNLNWLASARARLGYTVTPDILVYGTGGGAWGGFDYNASFVNTAVGSNNWASPFSATSAGYVVGGGAEWMLASHWLLRGEYLFYHLGGKSNLGTNPAFTTAPILFTWNATDTHVGRVALSYKF